MTNERVAERPEVAAWSRDDAQALYHMSSWTDGYFSVNEAGHVVVRPKRDDTCVIDVMKVVEDVRTRNIPFPVLIRFQDVLHGRVRQLNEAFREVIAACDYDNRYISVYPIKVNQLHEVVEEVLEAGIPYGLGLECGSRTELVAALPHLTDEHRLLICNGYKDVPMLRQIINAQQLGKQVIPVLEKYDEFIRLRSVAREQESMPQFGVRVRLSTGGAGKWAGSSGDSSKFGISIPELQKIVSRLSGTQRESFSLLHFHLGSQISNIQTLTKAVTEITRIFVQLVRAGIPLKYLDVGGGLGVNYDTMYTPDDEDAINYSMQEYANSVVHSVKAVCDAEQVPHPIIISESGRAITAHHSVLIVEAIGSYSKDVINADFKPSDDDHAVVTTLYDTLAWVTNDDQIKLGELLEAYHDAVANRQQSDSLFGLGYLALQDKATAERLFWSICSKIDERVRSRDIVHMPTDLQAMQNQLIDQYLCDFSVFQSMLDHWAIGQRFPIMPVHRLDERPGRRASLVDLTCDSDGKVSRYVSADPERGYLEAHALREDQPYYLGMFLMGAYQDIMGDAHNLFGRVAEVHVYADAEESDGYYIEKTIPGTSVEEMLANVQYFSNDLQRRMAALIREKVDAGVIRPRVGVKLLEEYKQMFAQSTYLTSEFADS